MSSQSSRRLKRQNMKQRYVKIREDLQLAGILPTTPEGALKPEKVDPRLQGCQQLPDVVLEALKNNWSTPDVAKPAIVGALLTPFYETITVLDKDGNQVQIRPDPKLLMSLAKTLRTLDQTQYARDNPEAAGTARGGMSLSVQANLEAAALLRSEIERGAAPPDQPGALGDSGHEGQMEARPPSPHDKSVPGRRVEDSELKNGD